ncbi:MAG: hypothetical protein SV760_07240 [Halobacteria archaeon]|nr:hypothetical protein [Halobacteria archaeon]
MSNSKRDKPLLFIHGYMDVCYTPWWNSLEKSLDTLGFDTDRIRRVNLGKLPGTTVGSPRRYAEKVREEVERMYDDHGEVSIVAHSMGGISSRLYLEKMGGNELVNSLTTLGTPHRGTYAAYVGFFSKGGRNLTPNSDLVEELEESKLAEGVRYNSVWGKLDALVVPKTSARLKDDRETREDVNNISAGPYGHIELVLRRSVLGKYCPFI